MKRYLITGVAGFIGSRLAEELLLQGHYVIGIDNLNNYYNQDLKMRAKARNVQINWPSIFPINSVKAMRGALFFKNQEQISDYALKIFKAYWTDGKDISKDNVISQICEDLNVDSNGFINFINQETTKSALKENTQDLIDRGGFGPPTYFFKNSMFFGNDRIQLLEEQLKIS